MMASVQCHSMGAVREDFDGNTRGVPQTMQHSCRVMHPCPVCMSSTDASGRHILEATAVQIPSAQQEQWAAAPGISY